MLTWVGVVVLYIIVVVMLLVAINVLTLYPIDGPVGIFGLSQGFPKVFYFLLEELWSGANSFGPVGKCTSDTILRGWIMMAIPL